MTEHPLFQAQPGDEIGHPSGQIEGVVKSVADIGNKRLILLCCDQDHSECGLILIDKDTQQELLPAPKPFLTLRFAKNLAAAILQGENVRLPVSQQLLILAAATFIDGDVSDLEEAAA